MRLRIINPNTTRSMTETIARAARGVVSPATQVVAVNPEGGPVSIESHYDEAVAALGVLEEVRAGEREGCDAYVIACFGDPGLLAARELTRAPVVGIAEAAFHVASLVATRFSVVTTLERTGIIAEHLLQAYGLQHRCRRVRAAGVPVLALEQDGGTAARLVVQECLRAKREDGIGAIVLGCGGMAHLRQSISQEVGLPVVEGVTAAAKLAESMVQLCLQTSKHGDLAFPRSKPFTGRLKHLGV